MAGERSIARRLLAASIGFAAIIVCLLAAAVAVIQFGSPAPGNSVLYAMLAIFAALLALSVWIIRDARSRR